MLEVIYFKYGNDFEYYFAVIGDVNDMLEILKHAAKFGLKIKLDKEGLYLTSTNIDEWAKATEVIFRYGDIGEVKELGIGDVINGKNSGMAKSKS